MFQIDGIDINLKRGSHSSRADGICAMEAVAWLAGEEHSDNPQCACPVIAAFIRRWNDRLPDDATRTRWLAPLIPELVGTRAIAEIENQRKYIILNWLIFDLIPKMFDRFEKLKPFAEELRAIQEINAENLLKVTAILYCSRSAAADTAAYAATATATAAAIAATTAAATTAAAAATDTATAAAAATAAATTYDTTAAAKQSTLDEFRQSTQDMLLRLCDIGRLKSTATVQSKKSESHSPLSVKITKQTSFVNCGGRPC